MAHISPITTLDEITHYSNAIHMPHTIYQSPYFETNKTIENIKIARLIALLN